MIVPKLVSSKVCLEQFYSSTGIQTEVNEDDFRMWCSELHGIMDIPTTLIKKVIGSKSDKRYHFDNHKIPLPCDFVHLIGAGLIVNGQSVRWSQDNFHYLHPNECCDMENINYHKIETFEDQFGNQFSPDVGQPFGLDVTDITFDIQDGYINFNIKKGKVCMAYWSLPVDNEGFIMIPDTALFRRAVTDYLIWKNDYILWRQGAISDKVYQVSEENKRWSISAAANELKLPDVAQLQSMKELIVRLLPKVNEYYHYWGGAGLQEQRSFY